MEIKNPNGSMRTHSCGELRKEQIGEKVQLCGWVNKYRDLGGLHFIDLRDKFGLTQLSFDQFKGDLSILKKCSLESTLRVEGIVRARPAEALNKNMPTGEVEVSVEELEVCSKSDIDSMPFLPHGKIEATEDLKLKYRYLDLRSNKLQEMMKVRAKACRDTRQALDSLGFLEIETPILYKSTPEGARDYVVPSRVHKGKVYALPQSPQTLKQLLMIGGTDKYYQICKCFRDEDLRADRQPEFTQIDLEASFVTPSYIKKVNETILKKVFSLDESFELEEVTYNEIMSKYGSDKPDVRFGLEHHIVNDLFKDTGFGVFRSALDAGGMIKAIFVPAEHGQFSRKQTDGFVQIVKPVGGKGVAFFKVNSGEISAGISKFIQDNELSALSKISEGKDGTWLFFADAKESVVHASADFLRRHLGKELGLIDENTYKFLFVTDFPLFEWSEDHEQYMAMHHPFTMPREDFVEQFLNAGPKDKVLKDMPAAAYDVVCNGYELGSGSLRIWDQKIQSKMFELLNLTPEQIKSQFGFFIESLNYGTPPHAGMGLGLDRIIMLLQKTDSIRDVIAFPKTNSATDMMASSPSAPSKEQTDELHFSFNLD